MDADKKTVSNKVQSYMHLIQRLAMLLYNTKLYYGLNNPMVMKESSEVLAEIEKLSLKKDTLTFSVLGNTMFLNGEKLEIRDGLSKQFLLSLAKLNLGALDLRPGLTVNELGTLMVLLVNTSNLKGKQEIKKYLDEHDGKHIIPHLATYQLVQENEQVVKEGSVINVDQLSSKAIKDYASDLKNAPPNKKPVAGSVDEISKFLFNLQHNPTADKTPQNAGPLAMDVVGPAESDKVAGPGSKGAAVNPGGPDHGQSSLEFINGFASDLKNGVIRDRLLMRDSAFLCKVLTNLAQAINTLEELAKIIWIIGEFLIEDISSVKEVDAKRRMCEQLSNHLIAQWGHKENQAQFKKTIEESFVRVVAALQIKKHILAYIRHKSGLEVTLKKIHKMLKDVPEDNALYRQIKNELQKIGPPKYDDNIFT